MTHRRRWARGGVAVLAAVLVAGCGDGGGGAFDAEIAEVRAAVESGDHEAADDALDALAMRSLAARDDGTISEAELAELSELIESSRALLDQVVPTSTTSTTSTTTTEPPPPTTEAKDGDDGDDEKDDNGNKGKGRDKDDD